LLKNNNRVLMFFEAVIILQASFQTGQDNRTR